MKNIYLLGLTVIALPFLSCEDEEIVTVEVPKIVEVEVSNNDDNPTDANDPTDDLTPDFSFTNVGNVFSLTNLTEGASELLWFFGDSSSICNTENPTYTFGSEGGEIEIKLRASNNIGESFESTQTLTAPEVVVEGATITIDGAFDDWTDVDTLIDETSIAGGTVKLLKVLSEENYIYMYLEGTGLMVSDNILQIYFNTDNDFTTGLSHWSFANNAGAEILFEGNLIDNGGGFFNNLETGWDVSNSLGSISNSSEHIISDDNTTIVEFRFLKSILNVNTGIINIGFMNMDSGFGYLATLPTSEPFGTYTLASSEVTQANISCE